MPPEPKAPDREELPKENLSALMRAAIGGDEAAYRSALQRIATLLRPAVKRSLARAGRGPEDTEDIVQETLLAIHLKRHTWDADQPLEPWVRAIAHHKTVDALRRRGFKQHLPIDDFSDTLEAMAPAAFEASSAACADVLSALPERHRSIVQAISIEGHGAREVGERLGMTETAVRVTLHRALKTLAAKLRQEAP